MIEALIGFGAGTIAALLAGLIPRWAHIEPRPTRRYVQSAVIIVLSTIVGWAVRGDPVDVMLAAALICGSVIDFEHMVLPLPLTLGGAALALLTSPFRPIGWKLSLEGFGFAVLLAYLPHWLYMLLRRRAGQGGGDMHLMLLMGAWLGPYGVVIGLFAAAMQALLAALTMRLTGLSYAVPANVRAEVEALRKRAAEGDADAKRELDADPMAVESSDAFLAARLPFGPFLALGAIEARLFGKLALTWLMAP